MINSNFIYPYKAERSIDKDYIVFDTEAFIKESFVKTKQEKMMRRSKRESVKEYYRKFMSDDLLSDQIDKIDDKLSKSEQIRELEKITNISYRPTEYFKRESEYQQIKEHTLRCGYAYKVHYGNVVDDFFFTDKTDFTLWLLKQLKGNKKVLKVWAHNTSYDVRLGIDFKLLKELNAISIPISVRPFIFKIIYYSNKIMFYDTYNFFKTSLKEIGKFLNMEKVEVEDFTKVDDETIIRRCIQDVNITKEVVNYLYSMFKGKVFYSIPHFSFNIWRTTIDEPIEKINGLSEKAYYGGRCEIFRRGKIEDCIFLDVNSMYPYEMLNPLPCRFIKHIKNPSKDQVLNYINDGLGVALKVKVNIPKSVHIGLFPLRQKNKLIFPIGKYETYINSPEYILNPDYIEDIRECEVYELKPFIRAFVNEYYPLKRESTGINREFYKLILNSLYGKFGQSRKITSQYQGKIDLPAKDFTGIIDYIHDGVKEELKIFNGICYTTEKHERNISPAISSFITSYARAYLYNLMKLSDNQVIYCDTDSLIIPKNILNYYSDLIGEDLGKLKIESEGDFIGYAPKFYVFNDVFKKKGVPSSSKITYGEDKIISEYSHITGLNECIRRFNTSDIIEVNIVKENLLKDDKRKWNKNISDAIFLT